MQSNPDNLQVSFFRSMGFAVCCFILIVGFAWFRWQFIDLRPVHTDEAENAYILAKDLAGESYIFNPEHHHGPTLNLLLKVPAIVMGYHSYAQMEMVPLRAVLWCLGIVTLMLFGFFGKYYGWPGFFASMLLAGPSAYLTYYGNYAIHETLLGLLGLLLLIHLIWFVSAPSNGKAIVIGLLAGLMFATKITSLIFFTSIGFSAVVVSVFANREWLSQFDARKWRMWILCLVITALVGAFLVYSSFMKHPSGIWDAVSSLWEYKTERGHAKPWTYFLTDFVLPIRRAPFGSYEWGLWGFALIGMAVPWLSVFRCRFSKPAMRVVYFLTLSTLVQLIAYSCISYKTPWLLLTVWLQVSALGGFGFAVWWRMENRWLQATVLALLIVGVVFQIRTTQQLNRVHPSDPRNPLAYAATSANIGALPGFVENHLTQLPEASRVGVYGAFTWPLPWYLRKAFSGGL